MCDVHATLSNKADKQDEWRGHTSLYGKLRVLSIRKFNGIIFEGGRILVRSLFNILHEGQDLYHNALGHYGSSVSILN